MSHIARSVSHVQGDLTITGGDIVVATEGKGIVGTDELGNQDRLILTDIDNVKTIAVEQVGSHGS